MSTSNSKRIEYLQLGKSYILSDVQLRQIARLIYQTDPYIYPALFQNEQYAKRIIPELIKYGDVMFDKENLFVAMERDRVVGLILWHKGPMYWDEKLFYDTTKLLRIHPTQYVDMVSREYFGSYSDSADNTISVINVCVDENFRGNDIGKTMLTEFMKTTRNYCKCFELFVLADNIPAMKLYEQLGFSITKCINGFSVDHRELPCYQMLKTG